MKLCPTCQCCFPESERACALEGHAPLMVTRDDPYIIGGRYRLYRLISRGERDAVFAGIQIEPPRWVAVKRLRSPWLDAAEGRDRFQQDLGAAAALRHPCLAEILDHGFLPEGGAYVVLDWISGVTLEQHLNPHGRLPILQCLSLARQLADTLKTAHAAGFVHGGLKSTHLLLADSPTAMKIIGFGLTSLRAEAAQLAATSPEQAARAKRVLAPELLDGRPPCAASDVYQLGVIMYEMLLHQSPFDGPLRWDDVAGPSLTKAPRIRAQRPDVPEGLERLVMSCLERDPESRPVMADMARRLRYLEFSFSWRVASSEMAAPASSKVALDRLPTSVRWIDVRSILESTPNGHDDCVPHFRASMRHLRVRSLPRRWPLYAGLIVMVGLLAGTVGRLRQRYASPSDKRPAIPAFFPQWGSIRRAQVNLPYADMAGENAAQGAGEVTAPIKPPPSTSLPPPSPRPRPATGSSITGGPSTSLSRREPNADRPPAGGAPTRIEPPLAIAPLSTPLVDHEPTPVVPAGDAPRHYNLDPPHAPPTLAPLAGPILGSEAAKPVSTASRSYNGPRPDISTAAVPPKRSLREGDEVPAGQVDSMPVLMHRVTPEAPAAADNLSESVTVLMTVKVSETGQVVDTRVLRKPPRDAGFSRAAEAAVRQWRYKPAIKDGVRVQVWTTCQIQFRPTNRPY